MYRELVTCLRLHFGWGGTTLDDGESVAGHLKGNVEVLMYMHVFSIERWEDPACSYLNVSSQTLVQLTASLRREDVTPEQSAARPLPRREAERLAFCPPLNKERKRRLPSALE